MACSGGWRTCGLVGAGGGARCVRSSAGFYRLILWFASYAAIASSVSVAVITGGSDVSERLESPPNGGSNPSRRFLWVCVERAFHDFRFLADSRGSSPLRPGCWQPDTERHISISVRFVGRPDPRTSTEGCRLCGTNKGETYGSSF